ncbi:MAG TPA: DUF3800 domain-containing protein [Bacteroidales bacterium]|nr:DUF3800 domain-containing protein [Bacteroidales bacterium]
MADDQKNKEEKYLFHRFLDEAGDTTFYGRGKIRILGTEGVSKCFILGMLKINEPLEAIREKVLGLQSEISTNPYFEYIPSIEKKKAKRGYYLHAKDDIPEVRKLMYDLIKSTDCSFECVVARKIYPIYEGTHNGNESEFYADLLSHLLKNKLNKYHSLVLNIATRKKCTTHNNLQTGLTKALERAKTKNPCVENGCKVVFNIQEPTNEPLLNIADYFCWAVQRVFEKGEIRYYDFIYDKISLIIDLYDKKKFQGSKNYYTKRNRLTKENQLK